MIEQKYMSFLENGKMIIHNTSLPIVGCIFIVVAICFACLGVWFILLGTKGV